MDFGGNLHRFLKLFKRILEGFLEQIAEFEKVLAIFAAILSKNGVVEELALMIRATRGRSSRPNHMPSLLDALQTLRPVNFRRLRRDFHSFAKRASLNIAFGTDFQGFWEVLGGQLGGKN